MKVFIFGAGASYDAHRTLGNLTKDYVPPLVDHLFDPQYDLANHNHQLLTQDEIEKCRQGVSTTGSLEKWLSDRWEGIGSFKDVRAQNAEKVFFGKVTFYLWFLLQHVSSYKLSTDSAYDILLEKLKNEPTFGLISFNYDTLLDQAVQRRYGQPLLSLNDYFVFGLVKPHGSVNWLMPPRPQDRKFNLSGSLDTAARLRVAASSIYTGPSLNADNLVVYDPSHIDLNDVDVTQLLLRFKNQYFYPVLFMPLATKLYSFIEGFDTSILAKGKEMLARASEIYMVGYRANDEIIKDMFQEVKQGTKLNVVGNESAEVVMRSTLDWASHLERGFTYAQGFRNFAQTYAGP